MKPAAINASPIIVLAGAGYFDLLPQIAAATKSGLLPDFATAAEAVTRAGLFVDPLTVAALKAQLGRR